MKHFFENVKNVLTDVVTEFINDEYGYTKEVQKLAKKKKTKKKVNIKNNKKVSR